MSLSLLPAALLIAPVQPSSAVTIGSVDGAAAAAVHASDDGQGAHEQFRPTADGTASPGEEEDLVVQARRSTPGDPLQSINVDTYRLIASVDEAVIEPIADAYRDRLPRRIRNALSNFFGNLREPIVALNYLLQLNPGKAVETIARFAINTTVGFAGIADVAREGPFNLPRRSNGFANTLGFYGVEPGAFLILPLVGATTLRDMIGSGVDALFLPAAIGRPFNTPYYATSAYIVNSLDFRIAFDEQIAGIRDSDDPYGRMRDAYLTRRQAEIDDLRGRVLPVAPPAAAAAASASSPDE